jgi:hypothetical protein
MIRITNMSLKRGAIIFLVMIIAISFVSASENCTNNIDDDEDGFIDCYDQQCRFQNICNPDSDGGSSADVCGAIPSDEFSIFSGHYLSSLIPNACCGNQDPVGSILNDLFFFGNNQFLCSKDYGPGETIVNIITGSWHWWNAEDEAFRIHTLSLQDFDNYFECEDTCESLGISCGYQTICGELINCGECGDPLGICAGGTESCELFNSDGCVDDAPENCVNGVIACTDSHGDPDTCDECQGTFDCNTLEYTECLYADSFGDNCYWQNYDCETNGDCIPGEGETGVCIDHSCCFSDPYCQCGVDSCGIDHGSCQGGYRCHTCSCDFG